MAENNLITPGEGFIKKRYDELSSIRNKFRDRARNYAEVTLPPIMPSTDGDTASETFEHDYNTEGAKLVNSLTNKYVETLFPAGRSHVKLDLLPEDMEVQQQRGANKSDIISNFAAIERSHRQRFESINGRTTMIDLLKHLMITGNGLLYLPQDGNIMNYALDEYVLMRSLDGTVTEMITEDKKALITLDPELKAQVMSALKLEAGEDTDQMIVSLYTYIRRNPENKDDWLVDQSVEDVNIGEQNSFPTEKLRWIPVVWSRTRREIYGRGLVEEHYKSFWTLSILTEALAVGCVTLADIKFLVKPGSLVDVQELNAAATGTYHYGEKEDINAISTDRSRDIVMIKDVIEIYKRHLAEVFMYLPGTMRDAERVDITVTYIAVALLKLP